MADRKREWWEKVQDVLRPSKQPLLNIQQPQAQPQSNNDDESTDEDDEDDIHEPVPASVPDKTPFERPTLVLHDRNVDFNVLRTGFRRQRYIIILFILTVTLHSNIYANF